MMLLDLKIGLLLTLAWSSCCQGANTVCSTGYGHLEVHGLAIDGEFAYVSGTVNDHGVAGQPFYGNRDALLLKVFLSNCSTVWARSFGGENDDNGGCINGFINMQGVAVSTLTG